MDEAPGRARAGGTAEVGGGRGVSLLFLATVGFRGLGHDGSRGVAVLHVARRGRYHAGCRTGGHYKGQSHKGPCTKNPFFHSRFGLYRAVSHRGGKPCGAGAVH